MNIAQINVKTVTRVRDTFRPGWRIFVAVIFLLSAFLWLAAFHQLKSLSQVVNDETIRMRTLMLAAVTLPPVAVALFRKDDFGRLFFALATLLNLFTLGLVLLIGIAVAATEQGGSQAAAVVILSYLFFAWAYQLGPCYVMWLSLIPFGRWKAYRHQVNLSLRLWSGEWKGVEEPWEAGAGQTPYRIPGATYRLTIGWLAFALGVATFLLGLYTLVNVEFLPAVYGLELSRAWNMLANFELNDSSSYMFRDMTNTLLMYVLGFVFFFIYGYFLTQWRRERVPVHKTPLLQHMTGSDLLLLRSFRDDAKYVNRKVSPWMIIFRVYGWSFTFEQLIINRLRYLGQTRLVDITHEREELLTKWGVRALAGVLGTDRLRKFFISVLPAVWYKLPEQGGARYFIEGGEDEAKWKAEVEKAMTLARVVVLLLGTTKSLTWEMERIQQLGLAEKTLFVMPPLLRKKNYLARWQQFTDFVCRNGGYDGRLLEAVNPKRVLAVVVHGNTLVVITAKRNSQMFYESALDVATLLTVADPAQARKLIPRYLKSRKAGVAPPQV